MRETRAVWISTNYKLDWPPRTYDENIQKEKLKEIFDDIERKNLNTIFFQIRSNGTLLFKSENELFSPYITGNIGEFGSYDPLKFAVREAHKRGLEIHAWINTFRISGANDSEIRNNQLHISKLHPEWTFKNKSDNSIWLNPAIPEVRNYLVEIIKEVVANYNIDGIHLDFIRYPHGKFNDSESFQKYGNGKRLKDWRRENITEFLSELKTSVKSINPRIKLGVTPIGIYKSVKHGSGLEGFSDVFQDSREWMSLGIIDYAAPQIYWDTRKNPKFEVIAKNWIENSFGKNIIIGIAAYKPEVYNELEREISVARKLKAAGVAFFRYGNIKKKKFYSFNEKALPYEINIADTIVKHSLAVAAEYEKAKSKIEIEITPSQKKEGYFALYEWDNGKQNYAKRLLKIVPNYIHKINFRLNNPDKINYYYSIMEYDRLWNEISYESSLQKISIPKLAELSKIIMPIKNPILFERNNKNVLLCYSNKKENISISESADNIERSLIKSVQLQKGFNKILLNTNPREKTKIIITYLSSGKSVSIQI